LGVDAFFVYGSFDEFVFCVIEVFVEGGFDLPDFEGGEVAVVDAVFEGVGVNWVAEVGVGVGVVGAFWGGGEAKLYGGGEVF
jgi:hypothetical protein